MEDDYYKCDYGMVLNYLFRDKVKPQTHGVNYKVKAKARRHRKSVKKQGRAK